MNRSIKTIFYLLLGMAAVTVPLACEQGGAEQPEESSPITPLVRPLGTSIGGAVTKSIGPAGGSLQSADGTISLTIPPDALTSNTTVSIEPVSNTNIAGIGRHSGSLRTGRYLPNQLPLPTLGLATPTVWGCCKP